MAAPFNTVLGDILGIVLPKTNPTTRDGWGAKATLGNLEVWARPGVQFNLVEIVPGVSLVVEFPDEDGLRSTLGVDYKANVGNAQGAGFWVGLADGVAKAANGLTFGLVDGIGKYIPGAQKAIAKGEDYRRQSAEGAYERQEKMKLELLLYKAKIDAMIAEVQADAADGDLDEAHDPIGPPPALGGPGGRGGFRPRNPRRRQGSEGEQEGNFIPYGPAASVGGEPHVGCCRSCAVGGPCESSCHG